MIHIVSARIADVVTDLTLLSPTERRRTSRSAAFGTSRSFVRRVLGDVLGIAPRDVPLAGGDETKPFVRGDRGIDFSVSHGGAWIAVAVAQGCKVGLDIEPIAPRRDVRAIAEALGLTLDPTLAFAQQWARLEARCKATGRGLTIPIDPDLERGDGLEVRDLTSFADHAAAVAWTVS